MRPHLACPSFERINPKLLKQVGESPKFSPRFALKLVPCDHLDDDEAAKAADTTLAEAAFITLRNAVVSLNK